MKCKRYIEIEPNINSLRQRIYNSFEGLFWMDDCNSRGKLGNVLSTPDFLFFFDRSFDREFGKFLNIPFTSTAINFVYGGMTSKAKYYYVIVRLESCIKRKGRKIYRLKT